MDEQSPAQPEKTSGSQSHFVVIGGEIFAAEDIIDAIHGREFLAQLHPSDLAEIQDAIVHPLIKDKKQVDHDSIQITREHKTKRISKMVTKFTDGLRGKLPNRATILAALDKTGSLRFSDMTEFIARFAELSEKSAELVAQTTTEVSRLTGRVLDSSSALFDPRFVGPNGHNLVEASTVQRILGEGWIGGEWAEVNTVILERALLGQNFSDDDLLQLWIADEHRSDAVVRSDMSSRSTRYDLALLAPMVVGHAFAGFSVLAVAYAGRPDLILLPFAGIGLSYGSLAARVAVQYAPNSWITRTAILSDNLRSAASTIPGFGYLTKTDLERQAGPHVKKYRELFKMCQERIKEMKKTGFGRLGLLIIREIIGQESGVFQKNEDSLQGLEEWQSYLFSNKQTKEKFNKFAAMKAHAELDSLPSAIKVLKDFKLYLEAPTELDQELRDEHKAARKQPAQEPRQESN